MGSSTNYRVPMGKEATTQQDSASGRCSRARCECRTPRTAQAPPHHIRAAPVPTREAFRLEKRDMTNIYIELGGKKAIAWSLEWPGWCRIRTSEEAVVQVLIDYEDRY